MKVIVVLLVRRNTRYCRGYQAVVDYQDTMHVEIGV